MPGHRTKHRSHSHSSSHSRGGERNHLQSPRSRSRTHSPNADNTIKAMVREMREMRTAIGSEFRIF